MVDAKRQMRDLGPTVTRFWQRMPLLIRALFFLAVRRVMAVRHQT